MGIVQGITEFLPVSSSGHLAVIGRLLNIQEEAGLSFEVLLHVGTLLAVLSGFPGRYQADGSGTDSYDQRHPLQWYYIFSQQVPWRGCPRFPQTAPQ
ncbi:MAG: undecaprenyl-diphosphate phosphatase [Lachnospiraceae bacterium]